MGRAIKSLGTSGLDYKLKLRKLQYFLTTIVEGTRETKLYAFLGSNVWFSFVQSHGERPLEKK